MTSYRFAAADRVVVRDLVAGLRLWRTRCTRDGLPPLSSASEALLAELVLVLHDDTPLPQALPSRLPVARWVREYDSGDVARVLGVTRRGARWLAESGALPACKVGRSWVFDAAAVDARTAGPAGG